MKIDRRRKFVLMGSGMSTLAVVGAFAVGGGVAPVQGQTQLAAAQQMGVFGRTAVRIASPEDTSEVIRSVVDHEAPDGSDSPGRFSRPELGRVIVAKSDSRDGIRITGVPTDRGVVCTINELPDNSRTGACATALNPETGFTYQLSLTEAGKTPAYLTGLVSDDVRSVAFRLDDGSIHSADLGQNGFAWAAPVGEYPNAAVIRYHDGTSKTVDIDKPYVVTRSG